VITYRDAETTRNLASDLVRRYELPSVLPGWVAALVFAAGVPLFALTSLMPAMGPPSLVLAIAIWLRKIDLSQWLAPPTIWWVCMVIAYAMSATARQAVAARFQGYGGTRGRQVFSALACPFSSLA
jgi:hypothetical protein